MYRVKLDIDGVLRNMEYPMMELYNAKFNTHITRIPTYNVDEAFPLLNGRAFEFFFEENAAATIRYADPYYAVAHAVSKLKRLGCEINIVSYQPSYIAKLYTVEWLDRNGIDYDNIIFTNKSSKMILPADIVIDDRIEYLDEDVNAYKICISQTYNKEWKPMDVNNGIRCDNLLRAVMFLEEKFNDGWYIDRSEYSKMMTLKKR